jgi:hypothetical protein
VRVAAIEGLTLHVECNSRIGDCAARVRAMEGRLNKITDGGVEGEHKGRKVMIKPVGDGFEVEMMEQK